MASKIIHLCENCEKRARALLEILETGEVMALGTAAAYHLSHMLKDRERLLKIHGRESLETSIRESENALKQILGCFKPEARAQALADIRRAFGIALKFNCTMNEIPVKERNNVIH